MMAVINTKIAQGQCDIDTFYDTILIINDVGYKLGSDAFISKEYFSKTDSLYFYGHPDWKIVEFRTQYIGYGEYSPSISDSNRLTNLIKAMINNQDIRIIYFTNFKIINEKGELFEIRTGIRLFVRKKSYFNKYIDREKYKKIFKK